MNIRIKPVGWHRSLFDNEWQYSFWIVQKEFMFFFWQDLYVAHSEEEAKEYIAQFKEGSVSE